MLKLEQFSLMRSIAEYKALQASENDDGELHLPEDVTAADWALEKAAWQNPRIRAFLGCIRLLDGVLESNYAILHCSPDRLLQIWSKVRQVSELIRNRLGPLLKSPSKIPRIEEARHSAEMSLELLSSNVLADLQLFSEDVPSHQLLEIRKILCVSIGKLHAFLQDTFGELMAGDPRSHHDADYYLSKRFPQDIEEAEWLYATVGRLDHYLRRTEHARIDHLEPLIRRLQEEGTVPDGVAWEQTWVFLNSIINGLTPKLREVLALRGIRFYEMEILDRYAIDVPVNCHVIIALHDAGRQAIEQMKKSRGVTRPEREQAVRDLLACHASVASRMVLRLQDIDRCLRDLQAFVPIWLESVRNRRALLLKQTHEELEGDDSSQADDEPVHDTRPIDTRKLI